MSSAPSSRKAARPIAGTRAWRSLGARLALWYVVVTISSFIAVAAVFALRMQALVQQEGQRATETALQRYRSALESGGTEALRSAVEGAIDPKQRLALRITDEHDVEIIQLSSDESSRRVVAGLKKGGPSSVESSPPPLDWHVAITRLSQGRRMEIALHDDSALGLWKQTREISWLILACGLFSAVAGAFVITRRALRPVTDLARATQSIVDSGNLLLRVPLRGTGDDLEQLAALMNDMLARNEALVQAMKDSLDNVAHDLRTPLTRLRAGAELALSSSTDPSQARDALADVIEESDRVLGMLTTLMDIAGAETGSMRLDRHPEDLAHIAREAVDLYDLVSSERGVHVSTNFASGVEVLVDRRRILQVCGNLLDNAIKYTAAGGSVVVSVKAEEQWGILTVADSGMGIAEQDRARIWERLFRADKSRAEHGLGLGLSLVKAIVEAHDGKVHVESSLGRGSTFEVRLARSPREPS